MPKPPIVAQVAEHAARLGVGNRKSLLVKPKEILGFMAKCSVVMPPPLSSEVCAVDMRILGSFLADAVCKWRHQSWQRIQNFLSAPTKLHDAE